MLSKTLVASAFASLAAASTNYFNATTSIEVVTAYTTYCPGPTTLVEAGETYTVTEPTTLTITNCPCTRTHTFTTSTVTVCASSTAPAALAPPPIESQASVAPGGIAGVAGPSEAAAHRNSTSAPAVANGAGRSHVAAAAVAAGAALMLL